MASNYDSSAGFYDWLSRLVYGNAPIKAQQYLLPLIPANAHVLIIGGGTGRIIEDIAVVHPSGLHITYVELSAKMTVLSQKRNAAGNTITFINNAVENVNMPQHFDVVITPFLLDNYTDEKLSPTFKHIDSLLKPGALWLDTDFQLTGKWWQWLLLNSMIVFFKLLKSIDSTKLPDARKLFTDYGYTVVDEKEFYGRFMVTRGYRKKTHKITSN
ncbi:hypothetical protein GCM10023149_27180 [Mucilaginibacter gynuensis]|uniref:Methyltransferase domain-containing protein n=1 Tax=Mucilaginibacter gynuensis TaxID=1302236 RepID=A0ABP8GJC7_9SPHI